MAAVNRARRAAEFDREPASPYPIREPGRRRSPKVGQSAKAGRSDCGKSLRMVGEILIAQAPVLPELQRTEQHDQAAEAGVPNLQMVSSE